MNLLKNILSLSLLFTILKGVDGDGCTNSETFNNTVINMCERISVPMGRAYISVTTDNMGSSTRCHCTLRSNSPGMKNVSLFLLRSHDSHVDKCNQSLIQFIPFVKLGNDDIRNFTCTSPLDSSSLSGITTSDVTVILTRPDTSVGVSYCVFVQPDRHEDNNMTMSCQSDLTQNTQPVSTPLSSSKPPNESLTSTTASSRDSTVTVSLSTVASDYSSTGQDFPVAAVVGGVLAALVLLCLTVVVSVYIGCRFMARRSSESQTGAENSAYSSLSDVTRVTLRADPSYAVIQSGCISSRPGGSDAAPSAGVYETVEGVSSSPL